MITSFFILIFVTRLLSLVISINNEKKLIAAGAKQIGEKTSKLLSVLHVIYYFAALTESYLTDVQFDFISGMGVTIIAWSLMALFYVIGALGEIWTVKVYIHPQHKLNCNWLFRKVRHPNYFLNVIPELIGVGLLCHAWLVMSIGLPVYLIVLIARIKQEQNAMLNIIEIRN